MGALRDVIADYVYQFKSKDGKGRRQDIRKLLVNTVFIALIICLPWVITNVHSRLTRHLYDTNVQDLPEARRWQRVQEGLDRIDCGDNSAQELMKKGIDISTQQGLEYALKNGLCRFAINATRPAATEHMYFQ